MSQLEINDIFMEWNPLEVPELLAKVEYSEFATEIVQANFTQKVELTSYLKDLLINKLCLDFDADNPKHMEDLNLFGDRIFNVRHPQSHQE